MSNVVQMRYTILYLLAALAIMASIGFAPQRADAVRRLNEPFEEQTLDPEVILADEPTGEAVDVFITARWMAAHFVSISVGLPMQRIIDAWKEAPVKSQVAVIHAVRQVGKSYRFAAKGPNAFDCSGLMHYAWGKAGVSLSANSSGQIDNAWKIPRADIMAGDLLYYPGHIMMSLGVDDHIVHAANRSTGVKFGRSRRWESAGRPG